MCASDYAGSNLSVTSSGAVKAMQNVDAGYDETVCVVCGTTAGAEASFKGVTVKQLPNCNQPMTKHTVAAKVYSYDASLTTDVASFSDFFTNQYTHCPVTNCYLK